MQHGLYKNAPTGRPAAQNKQSKQLPPLGPLSPQPQQNLCTSPPATGPTGIGAPGIPENAVHGPLHTGGGTDPEQSKNRLSMGKHSASGINSPFNSLKKFRDIECSVLILINNMKDLISSP